MVAIIEVEQDYTTRELASGVKLTLAVGAELRDGDVAVCSSDGTGTPGLLNTNVLRDVGFPVQRLHEVFEPPATLLTERVKHPVLVVQTVGNVPSSRLLRTSLSTGLELLRGIELRKAPRRLWLPLLGTGSGRLRDEQSLTAMLSALCRWRAPAVSEVVLTAPDPTRVAVLDRLWSVPEPASEFTVGSETCEKHVLRALAAARAGAGTATAAEIFQKILEDPQRDGAFGALRKLLGVRIDDGRPTPAVHADAFDERLSIEPRLLRELSVVQGIRMGRLWGRDLIAAVLVSGRAELEQALAKYSIDIESLCDDWYDFVVGDTSCASSEWLAWWHGARVRAIESRARESLQVESFSEQRPEYDADAYTSTDLLDIEDEVHALAYVLASKDTKPPLSIGLFGDWGSGKSFFIKHLRRRIERLAAEAQKHPGACNCHSRIAQIEFNAWHYQEGNLWASLVDHILRNLRFGENEDATKLRERRDELIRKLQQTETAEQNATEREREATRRLSEAQTRMTELQRDHEQRQEELARALAPAQALQAVRIGFQLDESQHARAEDVLLQLGITEVGKEALEMQSVLRDAKRELSSVSALFLPLLRGPRAGWRVAGLVLALLAPIAVAAVVDVLSAERLQGMLARLAGIASGLATLLVTAAGWLRRQVAFVRQLRQRIEPISNAVDESVRRRIEDLTAEQRQRIVEQMTELQKLEQQLAAERAKHQDAAAQTAALKAELALAGRDDLLRTFLDERIQGGSYQKELGLAALIRRDFERLSEIIEETNAGKRPTDEHAIHRIVLYIDDLDRCTENKVVDVLRAVHLLLAFPAFVAVVAVDSRWVAHCLEAEFPQLSAGAALSGEPVASNGQYTAATPLDYLEKIFQIPIWLEPMSVELRVKMATKLLGRVSPDSPRDPSGTPASRSNPKGKSGTDGSGQPGKVDGASNGGASSSPSQSVSATARAVPAAADRRPRDPASGGSDGSDAHPTPSSTGNGASAGATQHSAATEDVIDLNPKALRISPDELAFLEALGPLLSPSPRVLKRFVNTYRLFKATQSAAYASRSDGPSDHRVCMFLLAVLIGMPEISKALQAASRETLGSTDDLRAWLKFQIDGVHGTPLEAEWKRIDAWLAKPPDGWKTPAFDRIAFWIPRVGRYTFSLSR